MRTLRRSSLVAAALVAIFTQLADAGPSLETLSIFGEVPVGVAGKLIPGPDGYLWGASSGGGANGDGTVFKVKPDGSDLQVVHSFIAASLAQQGAAPTGGLTYDGAGFMWGATAKGGVIYFNPQTAGTIYKIKVSTGEVTVMHKFREDSSEQIVSAPCTMVKVGTALWGVGGNSIFKITTAGKLSVVADIPGSGNSVPQGDLMYDGKLVWGTTIYGGTNNNGQIFSVDAAGHVKTYAFTGANGSVPRGGLIAVDAKTLWGTTSSGGANGLGAVFKFDKSTEMITTVVDFTGTMGTFKGKAPQATLVRDDAGALWGSTVLGGAADAGTVFKIDLPAETFATKTEFDGTGATHFGAQPLTPFADDGAGNFIGSLSKGGGDDQGRLFKINRTTAALTNVMEFDGVGRTVSSPLSADGSGKLWGLTRATASFNDGTIFKFDPATGSRTTVMSFGNYSANITHLAAPSGKLYYDSASSTFWGTAEASEQDNGGIFKINATTGVFTPILKFDGTTNVGSAPLGGMVSDGAGSIWGVTYSGGASGAGTIFKINITSNVLTTVAEFTGTSGAKPGRNPGDALVDDGAGFFWGTASGGANGGGVIFKIGKTTPFTFTAVQQFTGGPGTPDPGSFPHLSYLDASGNLWGAGRRSVLKINRANDAITIFPTTVSYAPSGRFTPDGAGFLWDTIGGNVSAPDGAIARVDLATGLTLRAIDFHNGLHGPFGPMYRDATTGAFYGVTLGAIFRLNATGGPDLPEPPPRFDTMAVLGQLVPTTGVYKGKYGSLGTPETGAFSGLRLNDANGQKPDSYPAVWAPDGTERITAFYNAPDIMNAGVKTIGPICGDAAKAVMITGVPFTQVTKNDDEILIGGLLAGPPKTLARENQVITGQPGDVRLKKILTFDGNGTLTFFLAQFQGSDVTGKSDLALCVADGDVNQTVRALVREGDPFGGNKHVTTIATLVALKGTLAQGRWRASGNSFGVRLTFDDKSQGYFTIPATATSSADWIPWLATDEGFGSAKIAALGFPAFGANGPAGVITLKAGTQPVVKAHDTLVVREDIGGATILATEGNPSPDASGVDDPVATFKSFSEPATGSGGRSAFMATLAGTKHSPGIWYAADGDHLKALARIGDPAPGGGVWSKFLHLVLPAGATSGPHILATLKTDKTAGISTANSTGLWSVRSDGTLQLTLRAGISLDILDQPRTLKSFVALGTNADSLGAAHGYDDSHIAVLATFTDKTQALLRLAIP